MDPLDAWFHLQHPRQCSTKSFFFLTETRTAKARNDRFESLAPAQICCKSLHKDSLCLMFGQLQQSQCCARRFSKSSQTRRMVRIVLNNQDADRAERTTQPDGRPKSCRCASSRCSSTRCQDADLRTSVLLSDMRTRGCVFYLPPTREFQHTQTYHPQPRRKA